MNDPASYCTSQRALMIDLKLRLCPLPSSLAFFSLLRGKPGQWVTRCFPHSRSPVVSSTRQEAGGEVSGRGFFLPGLFSNTIAELPKHRLACYAVIGTHRLREQERG